MSGYAAFAATHEERLVRSLVAETGLPRASAQAVAREVLAVAWERGVTFPDGAAYGWLRVAARHCAADPASAWAAAADTALVQAPDAVAALAALPADDRALLRLRYVEGLLPAAIAERLGTTAADVLDRLDRARTGAARGFARRPRVMAVLRPVAAVALGASAAATLLLSGARTGVPLPPYAAGQPAYGTAPLVTEPVDAAPHVAPPAPVVVIDSSRSSNGADLRVPGGDDDGDLHQPRKCALPKTCLPKNRVRPDEIHVPLPTEVGEVYGNDEVVVENTAPVAVCDNVPSPPAGVAKCVPGTRG